MDILKQSRDTLTELRESFSNMDKMILSMKNTAAHKHLTKLFYFRRNTNNVITWTKALQQVDQALNLAANGKYKEVYELAKTIRQIRAKVADPSVGHQYRAQIIEIFDPYFDKMNVAVQALGEKLKEVLRQTVPVAIQSVLDEEEGGDKLKPLKAVIFVCAQERALPLLTTHENPQVSVVDPHIVTDCIEESVAEHFSSVILQDFETFDAAVESTGKATEALRAIEPVITALEEALVPLSGTVPVFTTCLDKVYGLVMNFLTASADPQRKINANDMLKGMQFLQWFKEMLQEQNYSSHFNLEDIDRLGGKILVGAVDGMREQMCSFCKACATTHSSAKVLENPQGNLFTEGPVDLFYFVNGLLKTVINLATPEIMVQFGEICVAAIQAYLDEIKQGAAIEAWEERIEATGDTRKENEWGDERLKYLCAFCNDVTTMEPSFEHLEGQFSHLYDSPVAEDEEAPSKEAAPNPFQNFSAELPATAISFVDQIVDYIAKVVTPKMQELFSVPWQNKETNPFQSVTQTVVDYNGDLKYYLAETWHARALNGLIRKLTIGYEESFLRYLRGKKDNVCVGSLFSACVARDIELWEALWKDLLPEKMKGSITICCSAMEKIKDILAVKDPETFNQYLRREFLDDFGDAPTFLVQTTFERRTDIDKKTKEKLIAVWKERIAYQNRNASDLPTAGWNREPSLLNCIDRSLVTVEKTGFWSKKSDSKKKEEPKKKPVKPSAKQPPRPSNSKGTVEVVSLDDVLRGKS